eukprot:UN28958
MKIEPTETNPPNNIPVRFKFGIKKKVRKLSVDCSFDIITDTIKKVFPAYKDTFEINYKEFSIESKEDYEGAVSEFLSLDKSERTYWFDLLIIDPNTPKVIEQPKVEPHHHNPPISQYQQPPKTQYQQQPAQYRQPPQQQTAINSQHIQNTQKSNPYA